MNIVGKSKRSHGVMIMMSKSAENEKDMHFIIAAEIS
jgi:hypothetical protein